MPGIYSEANVKHPCFVHFLLKSVFGNVPFNPGALKLLCSPEFGFTILIRSLGMHHFNTDFISRQAVQVECHLPCVNPTHHKLFTGNIRKIILQDLDVLPALQYVVFPVSQLLG